VAEGSRGSLATLLAFSTSYVAVGLGGLMVVRSAMSESSGGFAGLALALSLGGFVRLGAIVLALATTYVVLRSRHLVRAGATTVLVLAAWWIVTPLLQLLPRTGWRGQGYAMLAVALVVAPLTGREAALRLPGRFSPAVALGVSLVVLVVASVASSTTATVVTQRAVDDLIERDREQDQIDFTPYVAMWIPPEVTGPTEVIGPIVGDAEITIAYGYNSTFRVLLTEARAAPCGDHIVRSYSLTCSAVAELDDGTHVMRAGDVEDAAVWIEHAGTVVIVQCVNLSTGQGCIDPAGQVFPSALRILASLAPAEYTPPEPLSSDDPILEPLGGNGSVAPG
jgi:hypothetical protein